MKVHLASALFALGLASATARADTNRPLQVPGHSQVKVDVNLEVSIADGAFFDPAALAPDVFYGINDSLAVALLHSATSQGLIGIGGALRLGGDTVYNSTGLEGYYTFLRNGTFTISAQGGLYADLYSPDFLASIKLGAIARLQSGALELVANPHIRLPLNESDVRDNAVNVPLFAYYNVNPDAAIAVVSGLNDKALQLGLGGTFNIPGPVDVGGHLGWPRIAGDGSAGDVLAMTVYGSARF